MREYLFHGKRVYNGEWVEGYYVKRFDRLTLIPKCYILVQEEETSCITGEPTGFLNTEFTWYEVDPETVGEFTGIYDINKRKIFENDIIKSQPYTDRPYSKKAKSKQHIGIVKYYTRHFKNRVHEQIYDAGWTVEIKDLGKFTCYDWSEFFKCEVIGNIFDNKDLLDGYEFTYERIN